MESAFRIVRSRYQNASLEAPRTVGNPAERDLLVSTKDYLVGKLHCIGQSSLRPSKFPRKNRKNKENPQGITEKKKAPGYLHRDADVPTYLPSRLECRCRTRGGSDTHASRDRALRPTEAEKKTGAKKLVEQSCKEKQARPTGLEPATTGSTVQYSNQLSYGPNACVRPLIILRFAASARALRSKKAGIPCCRLNGGLRTPLKTSFSRPPPHAPNNAQSDARLAANGSRSPPKTCGQNRCPPRQNHCPD